MASEFIVSVTEADFEYEVIAYSQNTPVVVDFWAEWCKPCKLLSPMLEALTDEAGGDFRLAKVDVDANPNLAMRFSVRTIPTVIAFSQGAKVSEFSGMIPEPRLREFVDSVRPPSPANLMVEKGESLLAEMDLQGAMSSFLEALDAAPAYPGALFGLMKTHLLLGNAIEAREIFKGFPACREYNNAEKLIPLIKNMEDLVQNKLPEETDLDAAFTNSIRLASRGNIYASIDGLLGLLKQDRKYRKDRAKNAILSLLELLDQNGEETRQYRAELATILF